MRDIVLVDPFSFLRLGIGVHPLSYFVQVLSVLKVSLNCKSQDESIKSVHILLIYREKEFIIKLLKSKE